MQKNRSLSTPTDEQASVNTPEASSGTASNKNISPGNSDVNIAMIKKKASFTVNGTAPIAGGYANDASINRIQHTEKYVNVDN